MIVPVLNNDTFCCRFGNMPPEHMLTNSVFRKGWWMPGETDAEAANRELQEEIGMATVAEIVLQRYRS